ncbi:MAG: cell division protein SepF [Coriobacteriales bacterium]|nr:cell division protein SepF [Coriobacteriales bacterium]
MKFLDTVKSKVPFLNKGKGDWDDSQRYDDYDGQQPADDDYYDDDRGSSLPPSRTYSRRDPERTVRVVERSYSDRPATRSSVFGGYDQGYGEAPGMDDEPAFLRSAGEAPSAAAARRGSIYAPASVTASSVASGPKLAIVTPASYNEAEAVTKAFKRTSRVVLSLKEMRPELAKRILDFSFGVASALDGSVEKVADRVFLLSHTPGGLTEDELRQLKTAGIVR